MTVDGYEPNVHLLYATPEPTALVAKACEHTTGKTIKDPRALIQYLLKAEHTGVFEHVNFTFEVSNVSRALMAQVTRHRIGTFTMSSQHYRNYDDFAGVGDYRYIPEMQLAFDRSISSYRYLMSKGVPKEEARMVLNNSITVSFLWTINARSMCNFLKQRLCLRNVKEMRIFATEIHLHAEKHWPDLFNYIGPPCEMGGKCNQRPLHCGRIIPENKWKHMEE